MKRHIPFLLFLVFIGLAGLFTGCRKKEDRLAFLQGEWVEYNARRARFAKQSGLDQYGPTEPRGFHFYELPEAFRVTADSVEFYNGIFVPDRREYPGFPNHKFKRFCANFTDYHLSGDSIIIRNCETRKWELFGRIKKVTKDSLFLFNPVPNTGARLFLRPKPAERSETAFDQIIYSYGAGSNVYQISVENNGKVYVSGCIPVPGIDGFCLDVYQMQLGAKETRYIFSKFSEAAPLKLANGYITGSIDGSTAEMLFIKSGKIEKSIIDDDESAPDRLYWAYQTIIHLRDDDRLKPLPAGKPARFIFTDVLFRQRDSVLALNAAEKHLLWLELYKAPEVTASFQPTFKLDASWDVYEPRKLNPKTNRYQAGTFESVFTDGRFYRFYPKTGQAFTLDLGYDFIKRHMKDYDYDQKRWVTRKFERYLY